MKIKAARIDGILPLRKCFAKKVHSGVVKGEYQHNKYIEGQVKVVETDRKGV